MEKIYDENDEHIETVERKVRRLTRMEENMTPFKPTFPNRVKVGKEEQTRRGKERHYQLDAENPKQNRHSSHSQPGEYYESG